MQRFCAFLGVLIVSLFVSCAIEPGISIASSSEDDTRFSRNVSLGDGEIRLDVSSEPEYKDGVSIDTRIRRSAGPFAFEGRGAGFTARFADRPDHFVIEGERYSIEYRLLGARPGLHRQEGRSLDYHRVFPSTDLRYEVLPGGVKEELILFSADAPTEFRFEAISPGLTPTLYDEGEIWFHDQKGELIFLLPPPFAIDSSTEQAVGHAWYDLEVTGARSIITVNVDAAWVRAPERVFPIFVDPTTINMASGLGGNRSFYFDILFPQTFSYTYSGHGHKALLKTSCGIFEIFDPSGALKVYHSACGNRTMSGSRTVEVGPTEVGAWRVRVRGTNKYSKASGSVTYQSVAPPDEVGTGVRTTDSIQWTWTDPNSNETGHRVYETGTDTIVVSTGANVTSAIETSLARGTRYSREIAAYRTYDLGTDVARAKPIVQWTLPYTGYQYHRGPAWNSGIQSNVAISGDALVLDQIHTVVTSTWVDEFDNVTMDPGYEYGGSLGDSSYTNEYDEEESYWCGEAGSWSTQSSYVYSGTRAARSVQISCENANSWMSRQFENVAAVRFWYLKPAYYSNATFSVGDVHYPLNSTSVWSQFNQEFTPGTYTFWWNYQDHYSYDALYIDRLEIDHEWIESTYVSSGTWERVIDSEDEAVSRWFLDSTVESTPVGTSVTYEFATSSDNKTWSDWQMDIANVPLGRYLKVRITLSTTDEHVTPVVESLIVYAHSDLTPPTTPGRPSVVGALHGTPSYTSNDKPTWTWDASTDENTIRTYHICVSPEGAVCDTWIDTGGPDTSWTHKDSLAPGTTYYAIVKAEDFVGNIGPESDPGVIRVVVETNPPVMTGAPTPDIPGPTELTTITWSWSPASDESAITGYFIKVTQPDGSIVVPERAVGTSLSTTTELPSPTVVDETVEYHAYVRAVDIWGNQGDWSLPGSVEIKLEKPIASPPVPMSGSPTEQRVITWNWEPADDESPIAEYFIRIGTSSGTSDIVEETSTNTALTFTYRLPGPGTYYAGVRARDSLGALGEWSDPGILVISPDSAPPTTPGTPSTGNYWTSDRKPAWTWNASTDASGIQSYAIRIGTREGRDDFLTAWFDAPSDGSATITWADYGSQEMQVGRHYYAQVQAIDWANRESAWSDVGKVYIDYTSFEAEVVYALTATTAPAAAYTLDTNSPVAALVHGMREAVSPVSGALTYAERDLAFPGRGGFDLVLDRYYFSSMAALYRMAAAVRNEEEVVATLRSETHLDDVWGLGTGWSFAFPSIEVINEGDATASYLHLGDGRVFRISSWLSGSQSNLEGYVLNDMKYYTDNGLTVNGVRSTHSLRLKDGTKYYFGTVAPGKIRLIGITNRYDDRIEFYYTTVNGRTRLAQIEDTARRRVEFVYDNGLLVTVRYGDALGDDVRELEYRYAPASVVGKRKLIEVLRAPGKSEEQRVSYEYDEVVGRFSFAQYWGSDWEWADNIFLTLTKATLPSGGWLEYEYEVSKKYLGSEGELEYPRISRRAEKYVDASLGIQSVNKRSFTYSEPHHDGFPTYRNGLNSSYTYWTEVTDALGTKERMTFNWRHQMSKKETSNTDVPSAYRQLTEIVYDPDNELPIKETVTPYTDGSVAGSPKVTHMRHDIYGNRIATVAQGSAATTIYEPEYHLPERQFVKQDGDVYFRPASSTVCFAHTEPTMR